MSLVIRIGVVCFALCVLVGYVSLQAGLFNSNQDDISVEPMSEKDNRSSSNLANQQVNQENDHPSKIKPSTTILPGSKSFVVDLKLDKPTNKKQTKIILPGSKSAKIFIDPKVSDKLTRQLTELIEKESKKNNQENLDSSK